VISVIIASALYAGVSSYNEIIPAYKAEAMITEITKVLKNLLFLIFRNALTILVPAT
jgi:hypothetical protein